MQIELRLVLGLSRFCREDFFPVSFPRKEVGGTGAAPPHADLSKVLPRMKGGWG